MNAPEAPAHVYKIFRVAEWRNFQMGGDFEGSPDDVRDGFIHFSCEDQVDGTLRTHFTGEREVVVAKVSTAGLGVRMEASRGGKFFPHLYGPLPRNCVVSFEGLRLSDS
jgi:uncharacterized protein (DUF952 family)